MPGGTEINESLYQDFTVTDSGNHRVQFDYRSELDSGIDMTTLTNITIDPLGTPINLINQEMSGGSPEVYEGSYDAEHLLDAGVHRIQFKLSGTLADYNYWHCWWDNVSVKKVL